ncbi:dual specificity protein kinase kns1 [Boothiomyces sp. JEL0838]|nr:dual specificity protein kinase kns1 [Boothiomyces sp. JEL0838]
MSSKRRRYSSSPSYHGRKRKTDYYYTEPRRSTRKTKNLMLVDNETVQVPVAHSKNRSRKMLKSTKIILIDFGSTVFEKDYHSQIVSTRHYRAPEIILGLGWSYPCDIWSIGCILVELYTGAALFQTHENLEHLKMMEVVLGPFPASITSNIPGQASEYFSKGKVRFPAHDTEETSEAFVAAMSSIEEIIRPRNAFEEMFLVFIKHLLQYNPKERCTAHEALQMSFITFK